MVEELFVLLCGVNHESAVALVELRLLCLGGLTCRGLRLNLGYEAQILLLLFVHGRRACWLFGHIVYLYVRNRQRLRCFCCTGGCILFIFFR